MADDKDLLKKDLIMIAQLNAKIHYDKKDEVKKVHGIILQKNILKTSIGNKYIKRLEQILDGESTQSKCCICENDLDNNSAICKTCLTKIQQFQAQKETVSQSTNTDTHQSETFKNSQAQTSKENISQSPNEDENQTETTNNPHPHNTIKLSNNILTDKSKTKKMIIIGSILIILCIIVASIGLGNIFAFLTFIAICLLIYKIVKKQNKRNTIIALVILCVLTGIFYKDTSSNDLVSLMGVDAENIYDIYGEDDFTQSAKGDIFNSGANGDPSIILSGNPLKVYYICLESGSNSSLNVCGIHLGDSEEDVINAMEEINAEDYNSVNGMLQSYYYEYNSNDLLLMYTINDGIVEMISVAIPNN